MGRNLLIAAAGLSFAAALLHIGCIIMGAPWYRFFGAGERMAQLAEAGSWYPAAITAGIACVLALWGLYALSGAGIIARLPLLKTALVLITAVYLLRGLAGYLPVAFAVELGNSKQFWFWSSTLCLAIGLVHLIGLIKRWPQLAQ